jgi:anti-anti-sigma factor
MSLNIITEQSSKQVMTIRPAGLINSETTTQLDREIKRALAASVKTIILDMQKVELLTSAGVGVIVKAKTSLSRVGGDLIMINLPPQIKKVFEIIKLLPAMNVFESTKELDEYLAKVQQKIIDEQ